MASGVWDSVWEPAVMGGWPVLPGGAPLIPSHTDPQEPVAVVPWPPTRPGGRGRKRWRGARVDRPVCVQGVSRIIKLLPHIHAHVAALSSKCLPGSCSQRARTPAIPITDECSQEAKEKRCAWWIYIK